MFLENPPSLRGSLVCARGTVWSGLNLLPSALPVFCDYFNVVDDGPYRFSTAGSPGCKFADRFVRPRAPCRQYPFGRAAAGVLQVPERLKENQKFTWHRNSSPPPQSVFPRKRGYGTARCPRQGRPEPQVLARFWLLLPRGKSNRRVRGCVSPGVSRRNNSRAARCAAGKDGIR